MTWEDRLGLWIEAGLPPSDFWTQTPRLFAVTIDAKQRGDRSARAWLAWHTAVIPLMKTIPTLTELAGTPQKTKRQTPAEMRAAFASMRETAIT